MQIKCPVCGGCCECDITPIVGQRLLCPFCESKFLYGLETEQPSTTRFQVKAPKRLVINKKRRFIRGAKKYCTNCGGEISLNTITCPRCGARTTNRQISSHNTLPNYLPLAIIILVFCCPVGLVVLIFALMTNAQTNAGNNADRYETVRGGQSVSEAIRDAQRAYEDAEWEREQAIRAMQDNVENEINQIELNSSFDY